MTGKSGNTFITARDIYREILKILIVKKKKHNSAQYKISDVYNLA